MFRLFAIFSGIFFISCGNSQSIGTAIVSKEDTIAYSYHDFKQISEYFIMQDQQIDTAYYKLRYPIFEAKKINDNIKPFILIDGEDSPEDAASSFIGAYNEYAEDHSLENINSTWFRVVNNKVLLNTTRFISLQLQNEEYTGGAHGQHYTLFKNIDILNDDFILLEDIVQEGKLSQLTTIAEQYFRKQEQLKPSESLTKDFFFEDGIFTLNDNFGITKNHLVFYYNEYEIRPYAEGPTRLEIPYSALNDILNIRGKQYIESIK